jgi:hypothetical protein
MPVRSLNSSVLKWPDRGQVDGAVRAWAACLATAYHELVRAGYFGSYARNDWGVGSDIDLVLVVRESDKPFERRPWISMPPACRSPWNCSSTRKPSGSA